MTGLVMTVAGVVRRTRFARRRDSGRLRPGGPSTGSAATT